MVGGGYSMIHVTMDPRQLFRHDIFTELESKNHPNLITWCLERHTKAGYFRAVDWADFLLFVVPTLVAERIRNKDARKELFGLVQACNLLMSWELSAEEQCSINRHLVSWNEYLDTLVTNGSVGLQVFTINQHLIQHYPAMINAYGPPRAYSARSIERAIGEYSRAIKSNSAVGVNAGNTMSV
ncbi:hypothetical protein CLU79DRAFT_862893 [Phycomyces nitens]|nr:hypothetical protein CLU79DRAFT_862893 [Phycomyces nitens]